MSSCCTRGSWGFQSLIASSAYSSGAVVMVYTCVVCAQGTLLGERKTQKIRHGTEPPRREINSGRGYRNITPYLL